MALPGLTPREALLQLSNAMREANKAIHEATYPVDLSDAHRQYLQVMRQAAQLRDHVEALWFAHIKYEDLTRSRKP